jgi:hypothetical protein
MYQENTTTLEIGGKEYVIPTERITHAKANNQSFKVCSLCRDTLCLTRNTSKPTYCVPCSKKAHLISRYTNGIETLGEAERNRILKTKTTRSGPFYKVENS